MDNMADIRDNHRRRLQPNAAAIILQQQRAVRNVRIDELNPPFEASEFEDSIDVRFAGVDFDIEPNNESLTLVLRENNLRIDKFLDHNHLTAIHRIENSYLERKYSEVKSLKAAEFPNLQEKILFHGTTLERALKICRVNLNWRLSNKRACFFSECILYSTKYPKHAVNHTDEKCMLIFKVLVGDKHPHLGRPRTGYDTSVLNCGNFRIYIKYKDNEFLPLYILKYQTLMGS